MGAAFGALGDYMKLYCQKCRENHEFTALEVELIVYSLQAELAMSFVAREHASEFYAQFEGQDADDATFCIRKQHLGDARDQEAFSEHCSATVDLRRQIEGVGGCDECCEDAPLGQGLCRACRNALITKMSTATK